MIHIKKKEKKKMKKTKYQDGSKHREKLEAVPKIEM